VPLPYRKPSPFCWEWASKCLWIRRFRHCPKLPPLKRDGLPPPESSPPPFFPKCALGRAVARSYLPPPPGSWLDVFFSKRYFFFVEGVRDLGISQVGNSSPPPNSECTQLVVSDSVFPSPWLVTNPSPSLDKFFFRRSPITPCLLINVAPPTVWSIGFFPPLRVSTESLLIIRCCL